MENKRITFPNKPVLKKGIIYSGDNGSLICLECAGGSAKFSGRDTSGQKVEALNKTSDNVEWFRVFGEPLSCERGCTKYPKPD